MRYLIINLDIVLILPLRRNGPAAFESHGRKPSSLSLLPMLKKVISFTLPKFGRVRPNPIWWCML
jgi:hypothetical protein